MRITVLTCFYNEAFLVPFYLRHYHFADTIRAFVTPSTDETRELLAADPRVTITDLDMPHGIDDELKVSTLNEAIASTQDADWLIVADADEFVWPPDDPAAGTVREYLASVPPSHPVLMAKMAHVYRGITESDLDPSIVPIGIQRRHGREHLCKPIVIRSHHGVTYYPGNHRCRDHQPSSSHEFHGAHWANADPAFTVTRRVRDRCERISHTNRMMGHGTHHWNETPTGVLEELASHLHDGPLF